MTKNGIRRIATFNRTALICAAAAMALAGCNLTAEQKAAAAAKRAAPTAVVMKFARRSLRRLTATNTRKAVTGPFC